MKMTKKKVFIAALAICLVAILSLGTLAWFTDDDSLTNKFQIAESTDITKDSIFSVNVTEEGDGPEDDGLVYTDVHPGDELAKVTKVTNTSDEGYDQYIRVIITIEDLAIWKKIVGNFDANYVMDHLFVGFNKADWDLTNTATNILDNGTPADDTDDAIQFVFYYNDVVPATSLGVINVFNAVKVPNEMTRDHAEAFNKSNGGSFNIDVKAQAVQARNIIDAETANGANAAYAAFQASGMPV